MSCPHCNDRGSRVVAALMDPHYKRLPNGQTTMVVDNAIPIVAPCICNAERAARGIPPK